MRIETIVNLFDIFPAIDLRSGKVVRLRQGDPLRQTTYSDDPVKIARQWLEDGAHWLHVVNLDGAFGESDSENQKALQAILQATVEFKAHVQFGGGLRSAGQIASALDLGIARLVLGTIAVENPDLVCQAIQTHGSKRVAVGLDARQGRVQVRGWKEDTLLTALELANRLKDLGLEWLIFTDVARDGLQVGLNLQATLDLARSSGLKVIASGGANSLQDVRQARCAGLAGVIVGRALYEGKLNLKALLNDDPC
jgi:phosphoribosylformimino-5-aminoimidazole carboxamide ribotide isomerase